MKEPTKQKVKRLKAQFQHDKYVECAMTIIEQVIEPLHYPKRGVFCEKYYALEDSIINIISKRLK